MIVNLYDRAPRIKHTIDMIKDALSINREKPKFYLRSEISRYIGNKFIPNYKVTALLVTVMIVSSLLFYFTGEMTAIHIIWILSSLVLAIISIIIALSFMIRLAIDYKFKHFAFSTVGLVGIIISFAIIYMASGAMQDSKHVELNFTDAVYFSIVTWTTLGYGDFTPTTDARLFTAVEALIGYFFTAVIVGVLITSIARTLDQLASNMRKKNSAEKIARLQAQIDELKKQDEMYPEY